MSPTTILNSVMWLTAVAGALVAVGQLWQLSKTRSQVFAGAFGRYKLHDLQASLDADFKRLAMARDVYLANRSEAEVTYRITIRYGEGTFEVEVRSPSNEVIDKWDPIDESSSPKNKEIAKARRALIRDLTDQLLGPRRAVHG